MWVILFSGGIYYGYLLYTPVLHNWYYHPVVHDVEKTDFYVRDLPFPAITICSNNKIVDRQMESVLLTQPWRGLAKQDPDFPKNFRKALTAIVMARENPPMLNDLGIETINILNKYNNTLPDILKKVNLPPY